ncbi:MAG: glycosyltransferase [Rhodospirillales bacterium]
MRILYIVHQFLPEFAAGTELVTLRLAKAAQRGGHLAEILTCFQRKPAVGEEVSADGLLRSVVGGVPVFAIPVGMIADPFGFSPGTDIQARTVFARFLKTRPYDLVHVTHAFRVVDAVESVREREIPYLMTLTDYFSVCYRLELTRRNGDRCEGPLGGAACHAFCNDAKGGINPASLLRRRDRLESILGSATDVIACSPFLAGVVGREFPDLSVRVLGHGIDLLRFRPKPARERTDETVFGYIGTISKAKGVDVLARAFAQAAIPNGRLDLIGPPAGDEALYRELLSLASQTDGIRLKGAVPADQVPAALAGIDVLCIPSQWPETFSLTMYEAFAAQTPVFVADLGNPAEVVRNASCGRVLPASDVDAWSAAIREAAADPDMLDGWRARLPLPARSEEETFLYEMLYREAHAANAAVRQARSGR